MCTTFKDEALNVREALLIGIEEYGRPHLVFVKLLNAQNARRLVVIVEVEIGGIELPVLQDNEYEVVRVELTQVLSTSIVIKALYIMVKPNSSTAKMASWA